MESCKQRKKNNSQKLFNAFRRVLKKPNFFETFISMKKNPQNPARNKQENSTLRHKRKRKQYSVKNLA